jgi:aconitate hydratase
MAGPKRPQDRVLLSDAAKVYSDVLATDIKQTTSKTPVGSEVAVEGQDYTLSHGDIVIAAITSCTNTSNPSVMLAAGLVAKKAREKGLNVKPWVKTSLAPGSQVVSDYLQNANLQDDLDALGFDVVGYGCTTCIGNSGPLPDHITKAVTDGDLRVASVLSGNRNFEGRVHALSKMNYLASPPLVVAYAIAGSMNVDLLNDPLGQDQDGNDLYLKDIWPSNQEVNDTVKDFLTPEMYRSRYANVFKGPKEWQDIQTSTGLTYKWDAGSTYVQYPPFFEGMDGDAADITDIKGARPLAVLGDSVTTDHISPAGAIKRDAPAGHYLLERQVRPHDFNSYGSRRGNHQIMMRGTFANIRIRNQMLGGSVEGGYTLHVPSGEKMDIYDAAMKYQEENTPLVVLGGKEYGTGSSRDWAAKGTRLLGVKAVIVESFERIHRSNLVGMGVLPLQFKDGQSVESLGLNGTEIYDITGIDANITPGMDVACLITRADNSQEQITLLCRIDTEDEVAYYCDGGILQHVLRNMMKAT